MKKQMICLFLAAVLIFSVLPSTAAAGYTEMTFSDDVVEYLKKGESFSERAQYIGGYWYIGYGCLINISDYPTGTITEEGAEALMRKYLQQFADYVNANFLKRYDIGLTQQQFDAVMAMCYALGTSWLSPENRLASYLINGAAQYTDRQIASAFAAWCHIGGINKVALQRRIMEAKIFLYGDYSFEYYGAPLGWNWVILDENGGENEFTDVDVFQTGEMYGALPTASRDGYYFAGWEKPDGTLLLPTDIVSENLNLKARWSATPVTPPQPAQTPTPAETPAPTEAPAPAETPAPTEAPAPAETPAPTEAPLPEETPEAQPPQDTETAENPEPPEDAQTPPEALPAAIFPDVPVTAWYAGHVETLTNSDVISGYEDGTFRPQNSVTWGEALKLILRSAGYKAQDPVETGEDEPKAHWASGYLALAERRGFVPEGEVSELDEPISRDAMADLCAAAAELSGTPSERPYADSERDSVLRLSAAGIIEGSVDSDGERRFHGENLLTRAEICAVLVRLQDYVARNWIFLWDYRIPINHNLKPNPYDKSAFSKQNGRVTYDDGVTPVRYGIDVSYYQGKIDWTKAAADGVSFAIIRCGYRTYGNGVLGKDECFEDNIRGALANGVEVGVYFFSQALNVTEAREELNYVLSLIRGYNITLPVVFDWEQVTAYGSRTRTPNWPAVTDCIVTFCDGIAAAGYRPMTYFNPSMAYLHLDLPRLERYPKWLANYVDVTNYYYDFQMWQYGSSGHVDGINGRVDMDILFTDFK